MDASCPPNHSRRPKQRINGPDRPPQLSPIDRIIKLHHGSSSAIDATPERLQASKQSRSPSLMERIEQLQRHMSSLNYEIAYFREMEPYRRKFKDRVERLSFDLEEAVSKLGNAQRQIDREWVRLRQS